LSGFQFGAPANLFSRRGRRPIRFSIFVFSAAATTTMTVAHRYDGNEKKYFAPHFAEHRITLLISSLLRARAFNVL